MDAKRVLFTTSVVTSRSTFLAGFAYYEIGRFSFARGYDEAYPVLMTLCFGFSVMAVALAAFIAFYVERSSNSALKLQFVERINNTFARWSFSCFLVALILYPISLGRIGFVYYSNTDYKYVPLGILYTTVALLILGIAHIIRQQWLFWQSDSRLFGVDSEKMIDTEKFLADTEAKARASGDMKIFREEDSLEQYIITQCSVVSGRAVYIAGFCQSGLARYIATNDSRGHAFLVCMSLASAFAILPAFLLSNISIFLNVTESSKQRALAIILFPFARLLFVSYYCSFFMLGIAVTLMGWGCGYENQAWITATCGATGTFLLALGMVSMTRMYLSARKMTASDAEFSREDTKQVAATMVQVNNIGSQATLASGFVFYNIVTFSTDILSLSSSQTWKNLFLAVNAATVMFGLVSAIYDSIITIIANDLKLTFQRAHFLSSCRFFIQACITCFFIALTGFLVGFALYGFTKYDPVSYIPFVFTVFSATCITVVSVSFRSSKTLANSIASKITAATPASPTNNNEANSTTDKKFIAEVDSYTEQLPALLNLLSGRSLFFGGFAYFSVNFFFSSERHVANSYLVFMSIAFCFSITIVMLSTFFSISMALCQTQEARRLFASRTRFFFRVTVSFALISMLAFLVAFSMIGYVKTINNYLSIAPVMLAGGSIAGLFIAIGFYVLLSFFRRLDLSDLTAKQSDVFKHHERMLTQINIAASAASFVAGNVFFEILFSVADGSDLSNYYYFVSATTTFASGCFVEAMATMVSFLMGQTVRDLHKQRFAKSIKKVKNVIFFFNSVCIVAWMSSIIALGYTKYDDKHGRLWQPSFAIGIVFVALMILSLASIKNTSDGVLSGRFAYNSTSLHERLLEPSENDAEDDRKL